jgi:hypothetical protein
VLTAAEIGVLAHAVSRSRGITLAAAAHLVRATASTFAELAALAEPLCGVRFTRELIHPEPLVPEPLVSVEDDAA